MSKENNISQFDSLFKQTFEGASSNVPPGVWEGVSSATAGAAGASSVSVLSKLFGLKGAAILGSVALIVTSTVLLTKESNPQPEEITPNTQTEIVVESETDLDKSANEITSIDESVSETNQNNTVDLAKADGEITISNTQVVSDIKTDGIGQPSNAFKDVSKSTAHNSGNSEPTKSTGVLELSVSSESVCLGQKVDVSVLDGNTLKDISWLVDGKPVVSNRKYMSFLFDKAGGHSIELNAINSIGENLTTTKNIKVVEADASFKVSQKEGVIYLTSLKPVKANQWYVNQVLVKENQNSTSFESESEKNTIVHVATNLNGCSDTAKQEVVKVANCAGDLKVPNIFTPYHQDGFNDDFVIDMPQVKGYRLTVYNLKDGKVVFDTESQKENWNGKYDNIGAMVPVGYYIYRLVYNCNGKTTTKQDRVMVSDAKN